MNTDRESRPRRGYAVGYLQDVRFGDDITEYAEKIDATMRPFGGRFLIHGGKPIFVEGKWPGQVIIIEFPDRDTALAWYRSDAYQEILPLRTNNSTAVVAMYDGVGPDHRATDVLG